MSGSHIKNFNFSVYSDYTDKGFIGIIGPWTTKIHQETAWNQIGIISIVKVILHYYYLKYLRSKYINIRFCIFMYLDLGCVEVKLYR